MAPRSLRAPELEIAGDGVEQLRLPARRPAQLERVVEDEAREGDGGGQGGGSAEEGGGGYSRGAGGSSRGRIARNVI